MKIAFLWNGNMRGKPTDGLGEALLHLGKKNEVGYFEPDALSEIKEFNPDRILMHAALTEYMAEMVSEYPYKKALCFAGGPIEDSNLYPFDLYFVESEINEREFEGKGKRWMRAFGINDRIFTPKNYPKRYDGCFAGAFASWKRPELFAPLGNKIIAVGQFQESEKECYEVCQRSGVITKPLETREEISEWINCSHTVINPASFWGGGQRLTLEAMACDVPPIVCNDSPKNCEYVNESGFGLVVNPDTRSIQDAIENIKADPMSGGREYVMSKWSSKIYADKLEEGLLSI